MKRQTMSLGFLLSVTFITAIIDVNGARAQTSAPVVAQHGSTDLLASSQPDLGLQVQSSQFAPIVVDSMGKEIGPWVQEYRFDDGVLIRVAPEGIPLVFKVDKDGLYNFSDFTNEKYIYYASANCSGTPYLWGPSTLTAWVGGPNAFLWYNPLNGRTQLYYPKAGTLQEVVTGSKSTPSSPYWLCSPATGSRQVYEVASVILSTGSLNFVPPFQITW